jgi:chloramphenicol 3-O phosphotransferase
MASKSHRSVDFWKVTNTSISAMHHTIALFSNLGLDVIVDHVILDIPQEQTWLRECVQLLHLHPVLFVRVNCPVEELVRRERQRANRNIGQAQSQIDCIHGHEVYDLTVDTYLQTKEECAEMIISALEHQKDFSAFHVLYQRWFSQ